MILAISKQPLGRYPCSCLKMWQDDCERLYRIHHPDQPGIERSRRRRNRTMAWIKSIHSISQHNEMGLTYLLAANTVRTGWNSENLNPALNSYIQGVRGGDCHIDIVACLSFERSAASFGLLQNIDVNAHILADEFTQKGTVDDGSWYKFHFSFWFSVLLRLFWDYYMIIWNVILFAMRICGDKGYSLIRFVQDLQRFCQT